MLPDAVAAMSRGRPRKSSWDSPRGRPEHVTHVLNVDSATYEAFVSASQSDLLQGCHCAFCGWSMTERKYGSGCMKKNITNCHSFAEMKYLLEHSWGRLHHRPDIWNTIGPNQHR